MNNAGESSDVHKLIRIALSTSLPRKSQADRDLGRAETQRDSNAYALSASRAEPAKVLVYLH